MLHYKLNGTFLVSIITSLLGSFSGGYFLMTLLDIFHNGSQSFGYWKCFSVCLALSFIIGIITNIVIADAMYIANSIRTRMED